MPTNLYNITSWREKGVRLRHKGHVQTKSYDTKVIARYEKLTENMGPLMFPKLSRQHNTTNTGSSQGNLCLCGSFLVQHMDLSIIINWNIDTVLSNSLVLLFWPSQQKINIMNDIADFTNSQNFPIGGGSLFKIVSPDQF